MASGDDSNGSTAVCRRPVSSGRRPGPDAVLVVERLAGEPATVVQHRVDATRSIASFAGALVAVHALDAAACPFEIDVASMVDGSRASRRGRRAHRRRPHLRPRHPAGWPTCSRQGQTSSGRRSGPWCATAVRPWGTASSTAAAAASHGRRPRRRRRELRPRHRGPQPGPRVRALLRRPVLRGLREASASDRSTWPDSTGSNSSMRLRRWYGLDAMR